MSPYNDPIAPNFIMKHAWALYAKDLPLINLGGHFPCGGNYRQIEHFRQIYLTKKFRMYDNDFGKISTQPFDTRNYLIYGNEFPPQFPV